jgi:hypothetical protein
MQHALGEMRNAHNFSVGKPKRMTQLGRRRLKWENNIKTNLKDIGCENVDWTLLAQNKHLWRALVTTVFRFH